MNQQKALVTELNQKTDGYVFGVCHPNEAYMEIKQAGFDWVRFDIPFPYKTDGSLSDAYLSFKERVKGYAQRGMKVMAITPYPYSYFDYGIDPRTPEGEQSVREIAVFMMNDLQNMVGGFQITNEMGLDHITKPLTLEQAARFIGIQLEAVYPIKVEHIVAGYNSSGVNETLHKRMKPYLTYCDYVGVDMYFGCFGNRTGELKEYKKKLKKVYNIVKKPLILQEFGYIGGGEEKTQEEKNAILQRYGVSSEEEARENIVSFVSRLPSGIQNYLNTACNTSDEWGDRIFGDLRNHLYCELPAACKIKGYPHTPRGQADFYRDVIPMLMDIDYLGGFFVFSYFDAAQCSLCTQQDCPTETRWGLVENNGTKKPAYFEVQEAIANARASLDS